MTFYVSFFAEKKKKRKKEKNGGDVSRTGGTGMQAGTEFPNQCDAYFVCKKKAEK